MFPRDGAGWAAAWKGASLGGSTIPRSREGWRVAQRRAGPVHGSNGMDRMSMA